MSDKVYEIPAEWKKRAFIDDAKYRAIYERSIKDLGDTSTLADSAVVDDLGATGRTRRARKK